MDFGHSRRQKSNNLPHQLKAGKEDEEETRNLTESKKEEGEKIAN